MAAFPQLRSFNGSAMAGTVVVPVLKHGTTTHVVANRAAYAKKFQS
jgi:hypothetical protein